ncbi:MAG: hypothetical protein ACPGJS_01260 [Flammeovirgaceae bacterium]
MKISLPYAIILMFCFGFRTTDPFNHCYQQGRFLILYSTARDHALPLAKQKDHNKNGTPDFIEDIALQLQVADRLYEEVFKLRHPLKSPRYTRERVEFIKVSMKNGLEFDGIAFDGVSTYEYQKGDSSRRVKTLVIHINNAIKSNNHTPAHELMHLYQNGYTLFKTRWYTEGMARWVESALAKGTGKVGELPMNEIQREKQVFALTYKASLFWNALAKRSDTKGGEIQLPPSLLAMTYTNGKPIIEDHYFYGAQFLKTVLEELDQEDNVVSRTEGLKSYFWEESRQKSADNNEHIWRAIEQACRKMQVDYSLR